MSEYQYYEFQAIDRPLSEEEQRYIRSLSSRVTPTPTQAAFTYSFGDFRGDPLKVLERYYDALLYLANWGSKRLAFRFPRAVVDYERLEPYYYAVEEIELTRTEEHVLLDISFHEEGGGWGWIEGEGILSTLVPLRQDILRGDLRALYLAWLRSAEYGDGLHDDADEDDFADGEEDETDPAAGTASAGDEVLEPPVPAGLGQLSAPLRAFVKFFEIDQDLVAAAAEASPPLDAAGDQLERWVALLPDDERNQFLVRVARGEPHVDVALARRLRELGGRAGGAAPETPRRTFAALLATAEHLRQRREAKERRAAERARLRRLEELARREPEVWEQVAALIEQKQGRAYDEAVALLGELRDLAEHRGERDRFAARIAAMRDEYPTRSGLLQRLRQAGLI